MRTKRYLKPMLLLTGVFLVGWTFLVDNFLGKPLTPPTTYTGKNGYAWRYVESTGKYALAVDPAPSLPDASTTVKGITKLSVAPAVASNPIAVGDNDPRNTNARTPTAHAASHQNAGADEVSVAGLSGQLADPQPVDVYDEGVLVGTRTRINFMGAGVGSADDAGNGWVTVTIPGGGGGGGGGDLAVYEGNTLIDGAVTILTLNAQQFNAEQAVAGHINLMLVPEGVTNTSLGADSVTSAKVLDGTLTDADVAAANKDGLAATPSMRTLGTGATQATAGDDTRLSDARTPTAHAASHQHGGSDQVATATPGANAIPKADGSNKLAAGWLSEVLGIADLSDVTALGGAAQALGASASNGSGTVVAYANHVHKGIVAQFGGTNLDSGNGNATLNVSGTFAVATTASSGVINVTVEPPAGAMMVWPTSTAPVGWFLCRGQAVSRTTYAALFAVINTTYGVGDGSTTFNLPDVSGRVVAGQEATATRLTVAGSGINGGTLGATGGSQTHTLTTPEIPSHAHSFTAVQNTTPVNTSGTGPSLAFNAVAGTTGTAGGGGAHQNTQPTIVLNWVIKY